MTRSVAAALLGGVLLALGVSVPASAADDGYRLHPRTGAKATPSLDGGGGGAGVAALRFDAPHGYVFTVADGADDLLTAAGARPLYPEAGLWGVSQEIAHDLRAALEARGLLVDVSIDRLRRTSAILTAPDPAAAEPLLPLQYMFGVIGADGLEPPAQGERGGVLVIDSGLDLSHADFAGRPDTILENPQKVRESRSGEWHGTAVASMVGAMRNGIGITGVYPGVRLGVWDAGAEGILTSETIRALRRAVQRRYAAVNMSFGGEGFALPELLAMYRAVAGGVLLVAAAGNENLDGNPNEFPALFPHVLTVTAVDGASKPASFSNRKDGNDFAAPGVGVVASTPPGFDLLKAGLDCDETAQWCAVSGTSFSAPIAAAVAAWVSAARPDLDSTQVFDLLRFSARDVDKKGFDRATGFGVISVRKALARKAPRKDPLEPNDEIILVDGRLDGTATRPLLPRDKRSVGIRARLDFTEDPFDVYRVPLRAGERLSVRLRPLDDDCNVVLWPADARSTGFISGTGVVRQALGRGLRLGLQRDRVDVVVPRTGVYYVEVRGNGRYDLVLHRQPAKP